MKQARVQWKRTGKPERRFVDFRYHTRKTWSRARRVITKAEYLAKEENSRFVVTSCSPQKMEARRVYDVVYCARGDMENRVKEQQLAVFADRTSTSWLRATRPRGSSRRFTSSSLKLLGWAFEAQRLSGKN